LKNAVKIVRQQVVGSLLLASIGLINLIIRGWHILFR
jgi:hypothetical protein